MAQITRYLTIVLALIQAFGLTVGLFRRAVVDQGWFSFAVIILVLTAGTAFLMWLGEQINERGIGNGISLIIFGGIVAVSYTHLDNVVKSAANIPGVKTTFVGAMNVYEIVNHNSFIVTKEAIEKIEEVYL